MNCKKVQFLMSLYMSDKLVLTIDERLDFENHLRNCQECSIEYEQSKFFIDIARKYCQISEDTLAMIEKADQSDKRSIAIDNVWVNLKRWISELGKSETNGKCLLSFSVIRAVAACLTIGLLLFFYVSELDISQESPARKVVFAPNQSIKIESISENGNILLSTNQQITSTNKLRTLVINDKHLMIMNTNTSLSIESLIKNELLGCLVKVTSGEIYTRVEHDGNPFVVDTANGQAVITGTAFNVKVTDNSTTLVVSEGTVKFKSCKGVVKVATGQTSKIVGQSPPSDPSSCNVVELTAWLKDYKSKSALVQTELDMEIRHLPLSLRKEPIILEETDYQSWIKQRQGYFKEQFPWIFQLRDALAKEGIDVDYPALLIQSGDVWKFICPEVSPARFSVFDPNSLIKVASNYGFNKQWLLENVPLARSLPEMIVLSKKSSADLKAFEQWIEYLVKTKGVEPPFPIYSYFASDYLIITRSLIWFAVKDNKYNLEDEKRDKILDLLQEEVTAACKYQNEILYPQNPQKLSCDEDKSQVSNQNIDYISVIYKYEKVLLEYISSLSLKLK